MLEAKKDNFEVISTTDVIERLSQDTPDIKKLIINQLKVNEHGARKLFNHYSHLKTKECELQNEIVELKEEIANLKKTMKFIKMSFSNGLTFQVIKRLD